MATANATSFAQVAPERVINFQLLKLHVDSVPSFNGDRSIIEIFLGTVNICKQLTRTQISNRLSEQMFN